MPASQTPNPLDRGSLVLGGVYESTHPWHQYVINASRAQSVAWKEMPTFGGGMANSGSQSMGGAGRCWKKNQSRLALSRKSPTSEVEAEGSLTTSSLQLGSSL